MDEEIEESGLNQTIRYEVAQAFCGAIALIGVKTHHVILVFLALILYFVVLFFYFKKLVRRTANYSPLKMKIHISVFILVVIGGFFFSRLVKGQGLPGFLNWGFWNSLIYFGYAFPILGAWWLIHKYWIRNDSAKSKEIYAQYLAYLKAEKEIDQSKQVSYEVFPAPLTFEEWKKREKKFL